MALRSRRLDQIWRPDQRPATRKAEYERNLRNAIAGTWLVEMRYGEDETWRRFAPYAIFRTPQGKVNLAARPEDGGALVIFEIGRITGLKLPGEPFEPEAGFDRAGLSREGVVLCSV